MSIEVEDTAAVSERQIRQLVDLFYDKVRADPELGPILERVIQDEWGPHLRKVYDFRSSVVLTTGRYKGQPVVNHKRFDALFYRPDQPWPMGAA